MAEDSVFSNSTPSPVTPTGEKTRGFSERRPWEFLFKGIESHGVGLPGAIFDIVSRVPRAAGETIAETAQGIGDYVGGLDQGGPHEGGLSYGAGGYSTEGTLGAVQPLLPEGVIQGDFSAGGVPGADLLAPSDEVDKTDADIENIISTAQNTMLINERLLDLENSGTLTPEAQFMVEQARLANADQLDQLQLDLEKAQQQLDVQDVLFDFQAQQAGYDHDLAPLREAIEKEGGVGLQTLQAIKDIANDEALSQAEKGEQIDLVMARGHFSDALVDGISEMVQNRNDLEEIKALSDSELAGRLGVDAFFQPQFNHVIETDPVNRQFLTFTDIVDQSVVGDVVEEMDDQQFGLFQSVIALVGEYGANSEEATNAIQQLAQATGVDFQEWKNVLAESQRAVDRTEAAYEASVDAKSLVPGSEAMAFAVANAGQELIEAGVDPEMIRLISNYPGLHAIIKVKSGGKAGKIGEGTIRGVGGLTEDMYFELMGEEWSPDKGMEWELQALLLYIMRGFGGDPVRAMDFYRQTGSWGGVNSMGGDEIVEQPNLP